MDWELLCATTLTRMREGESVSTIAKSLGVARGTLLSRLYADHADEYVRAREDQGRAWGEEAIELARQARPENAHAVRVTVDTLKWAAARLAPRDYGDRQQVEQSGEVTVRLVDDTTGAGTGEP